MAKTLAEFTRSVEKSSGEEYNFAVPLQRPSLDGIWLAPLGTMLLPAWAVLLLPLTAIAVLLLAPSDRSSRPWDKRIAFFRPVALGVSDDRVDYLRRRYLTRRWSLVESLPLADTPLSVEPNHARAKYPIAVGPDRWLVPAWYEREVRSAIATDNKRNPTV